MENRNKSPRRGPGGHGPMGGGNFEKAKDFKGTVKRLLKEVRGFRTLIVFSLTLAALGSVLSILAPNKLSLLTDEITKGLVINSSNLETLSKEVSSSLNEETLATILPNIIKIDLSNETIKNIMSSSEINEEEKTSFEDFLKTISSEKEKEFQNITQLPDSILNHLLKDTTYNGVTITSQDQITFLNMIENMEDKTKEIVFPDSIANVLFLGLEMDGVKVSKIDQARFIEIMSTLKEDATSSEIYKKIDQMPESIRKITEPFMNIEKIKKIALFLSILYITSALFTYIESISMTNVANKFAKSLRSRISKKINLLPLKYFDSNQTGDLLSRVTNDVDTIAQSMNQSLATLVSAITLFIGSIIMMFYTNWIMAITAILASLFGFSFMFMILGKSQKYFIARQKELGNLNGHIEEIYSGLNVVKAYNGKQDADLKFDTYNKNVYDANRKSQFLSGLMMPLMNFIGNFGYVAVCIVGALLAMSGHISFGVIVAFIAYVRLFTSPLSQIAQAMTSLQSTLAASERVFELFDEEEMKLEKDITKHIDKSKAKGNIEFEHVTFKYAGSDKPVIKDFTASIKSGEKIAIVGPTGAGKTTMVNLLMKFYDIESGDIKIDGISTKELTRENIHDLFTMVLQDTWLFQGTVKENIIYNCENLKDERLKEVCKVVGLDHFIKTLPNSYDSIISDNDSISSGQRQLLTIARGMLKDAPFLILDEATSNVDTRTEELVQNAMDKLTEGRTSFIIAHRLSTIKNADLILVMKEGNIIEQGNHEQLMRQNGFYAELYNSQFEL